MNKKRNQVLEYEFMVWKKAIGDTISFYRKEKFAVFINLFSIALTLLVLRVLGGEQAMNDEWTGIISGLLGAIGGTFLYLIVARMAAPFVLYREKVIEAHLPSWKDVEIKEFEFEPTSGLGVGLEIINHKPKIIINGVLQDPLIMDVLPKLTRISNGDESHSYPSDLSSILPVLQGEIVFQKSNLIKSPEHLKRDKQSHNAISIAKWNDEEAWILIGKKGSETKITLAENITYLIEVEIRDATVELFGNMFYICKMSCSLLYSKGKDGKRKVNLKLESRYPSYER